MLSSIGKFSKSLSLRILVGIIILPFVFWGMGDIFRGGNQNIIAKIDSEKINTKEFVDYLNRINLTEKERKNLPNSDLLETVVFNYIGKKIISLEIKNLGIILTDKTLKDYIVNDKTFFKDKKFSRTQYEKFLLESGITAPDFEKNFAEQEKKRHLLSFLSKGAAVADFLVINEFNRENQIKTIKYIDLSELYNNLVYSEKELNETYNKNKDLFSEKFKSLSYLELNPKNLLGQEEYDKNFFNKINKIENDILDGKKIQNIAEDNNLKLIKTAELNSKKNDISGKKFKLLNDELFKKIYKKTDIDTPELINFENKYYIINIEKIKTVDPGIKDKTVRDAITKQIKFKNIFENNTKIAKEISSKKFNEKQMLEFAQKKGLKIKKITLYSLKDNDIFIEDIIKEIFKIDNNKFNLITDNTLSQNFIIYVEDTKYKKLDKNSDDYEKYKTKAQINWSNEIYNTYDKSVNVKYKVDINNKVVNRIKNSF